MSFHREVLSIEELESRIGYVFENKSIVKRALDRSIGYLHPNFRIADGQLVEGEEHYEFYVDEASLWELVRTAYCQE